MLITTIDSFPDDAFLARVGLVESHVVIGANIFRDVFASFRDIFGGQVVGYKKDLDKLKRAATDEIIQKAKKVNCNAIIAVKTDVDELSGSGKSMFMYNIVGTAVRLKEQYLNDAVDLKYSVFDNDTVTQEINKIEIENHIEAGNEFDHSIQQKISENNLWTNYLRDKYLELYVSQDVFINQNLIDEVTLSYSIDFLLKHLNTIRLENYKSVTKLISKESWIDSETLISKMKDNDYVTRCRALNLTALNLDSYRIDDINHYRKIVDFVKSEFNTEIITEEKKSTFSSKEAFTCPNCLREREFRGNNFLCDYNDQCDATTLGLPKEFVGDGISKLVKKLELKIEALQRCAEATNYSMT